MLKIFIADEVAILKKSLDEVKDNSMLTKRGVQSKRRAFKHTAPERREKRLKIKQMSHAIRDSCHHESCNTISTDRRLQINKQFWDLNFTERNCFAYTTINRKEVKQRRKKSDSVKHSSFEYYLKDGKGTMIKVCKIFYLTTLGCSKSNDAL